MPRFRFHEQYYTGGIGMACALICIGGTTGAVLAQPPAEPQPAATVAPTVTAPKRYAVMQFRSEAARMSASNTLEFIAAVSKAVRGKGKPGEEGGSDNLKDANHVGEKLALAMAKSGIVVVERQMVEDALKAGGLPADGTDSDSAALARAAKTAGVDYLIYGSQTHLGEKSGGGFRSGTDIFSAIQYRLINVNSGQIEITGVVESKIHNNGTPDNRERGEMMEKATNKSIREVVSRLVGRREGELPILEVLDKDHVIIEIEDKKPKKGSKFELFRITKLVRNAAGAEVYRDVAVVAKAQVIDVKENAVILEITERLLNEEIKPELLVRKQK